MLNRREKGLIQQRKQCSSIITTHQLTCPQSLEKKWFNWLPHPPYSPDLALCDFCVFPKIKKMAWWKAFHIKQRGYCWNKSLFCSIWQIIFLEGDYVYWAETRVYWEINLKKNCFFFPTTDIYQTVIIFLQNCRGKYLYLVIDWGEEGDVWDNKGDNW